jgi:hypothetical protein
VAAFPAIPLLIDIATAVALGVGLGVSRFGRGSYRARGARVRSSLGHAQVNVVGLHDGEVALRSPERSSSIPLPRRSRRITRQ